MRELPRMVVSAARDWIEDKAPRLAAALSYYTAFSLPPLLVALVGVAGLVFGADVVSQRIVDQISGLIGPDSAQMLGDAIAEARRTTGTGGAVALGAIVLFIGAAGVFGQLQDALNTIWEAKPKPGAGIRGFIKKRLLSMGAVFGSGFLLLVSLAVSAAIGALVELAGSIERLAPLLSVLDVVVSMVVITVLFALIFKYLPDVRVKWNDVWVGAFITAALFAAGKFGIGFYLGTSDVGSVYGVAGSLIVILVWIYYSSLIVFFGAEFTQVWANRSSMRSNAVSEEAPKSANSVDATRISARGKRRRIGAAAGQMTEAPGLVVLGAFLAGWLAGRGRRR